ncbi:hypothetical protein PHYBLDRAFT_142433 [Phycomyces blakesleeanus NRRL 1555(-)]|uniref:Uncharacterized protein n=1 Tax=Phycomyces blakesleeanus (strain ATCC 8743b / DSM 1359 / FGSC 10004 / NBRC 33097 / NRRL 1555) TaxID=763407 RepID=A0A167NZ58_PHYB8|nr:hypothetical protein PHYBLDRAFT_142433 [Phycomyces blakesleeanus NRRL 1555(-)]OAD76926.1 hypothetical protein PHYBLDRAFT_142433 [Phycomyces blakesleeanus NRRL 1555(-)]|eukprot:XP_018294966.1 hypothetical protein PHYBLDRAFT_142433 [Phycomyces blakesleeanus NRRL 1555(-)]
MFDINTTLINSVRKIEIDIAKINQMVRMLQDQFSKQFAPAVSAEDLTLKRVVESVKSSQFTEYPDQLGKQVMGTDGDFKGKNKAQKYNLLSQLLNEQEWKDRLQRFVYETIAAQDVELHDQAQSH